MTSFLPPAFILVLGAILIPFLKGRIRQAYIIFLPCLTFIDLLLMPEGSSYICRFWEYQLTLVQVDKLSMVFAYIFVIMAFAGAVYAAHEKDNLQMTAATMYAGSSLGVVFAGDLITLYIFWEIMAFASVCLVIARRTTPAVKASFRYILVHLFGGLMLLIGILMHVAQTGSIEFTMFGLNGLASWFILIGVAVNAAIFPLSAWLPDAYPESTVVGTVFLSAFTTKTAVYVLARGFAGTEILVWAGIIMILYGIVYALLENDMRRVLSYSIVNQVGFMVVGVGIGTELAINGAAAHAFAHILYKALLMMSAGAVLYLTGRSKTSQLGGLYKSMPWTLLFCLVGAASISGFPLTGGFVTKSMILSAAGHEHMTVIWLLLTLASAGVFLHAGIKFPYFVFFAKDSGLRPKEKDLPFNMLVAMGFLAFLCIFIGVYPDPLYNLLPYPVDYIPYTGDHVVSQLQLLMFSALAFFMLLKYLKRTETITLDTDWFYRKGAQIVISAVAVPVTWVVHKLVEIFLEKLPYMAIRASRNPISAIRIGTGTLLLPFAPDKEKLQKNLAELKASYPGFLPQYSLTAAVGTVLVVFAVILYLLFLL